jgi:hypothetical protein
MKRFLEVVDDPETGWRKDDTGYTLHLDRDYDGRYEVRLEPLLYGQYYLAVYLSEPGRFPELVGEKVPVRPGGGKEPA